MSNRRSIGILVAIMTSLFPMVLVIDQPSYGRGEHGGYRGHYHGGYHNYGYPAYYAPAYNGYEYRGYAPYPRYGLEVGIGAAAGALLGGLLAPRYGHRYDY